MVANKDVADSVKKYSRSWISYLALFGCLVVIAGGALLAAGFAVEGKVTLSLVCAVGALALGSYYMLLFYISLGYRLFSQE